MKRRSAANVAKSNTATATTAIASTASPSNSYVGRFAPTPNGPLHLGSLVAALASYLDARAHGGRWLLRLDDLDRARCSKAAADRILDQLTELGFRWHGAVRLQSHCLAEYEVAFERLQSAKLLFRCDCTRQRIRAAAHSPVSDDIEPVCVADCRHRHVSSDAAWRIDLSQWLEPAIEDRWQGSVPFEIATHRDRIVLRRDGVFAYHLTVVVDDLASGVTDVVRGADLLSSVPVQAAIYRALGAPVPRYAHCPVVVGADGDKLAKSKHSLAIDSQHKAGSMLRLALTLLAQPGAIDLDQVQPAELLLHAQHAWEPDRFRGCRAQPLLNC